MSSNLSRFDAAIVGAGVIGVSLALALSKQANWKIVLIERGSSFLESSPFESNQRVTALGLAAKDLLQNIGVWQRLTIDQANPFERMFVWDEGTDGELTFNASDYSAESLGYMVDHFALQQHLRKAVTEDSNITVFYETELEETRFDADESVAISINNDEKIELSVEWIFAADGVHSALRERAMIQTKQHFYQQKGIVARIKTEHFHQHTAWQRFLSTGPLALLPLHDGQCSIVWSVSNSECDKLIGLDEKQFSARLKSALQSRLGEIELSSERQTFPLQSRQAESYVKDRLVLIGDAAHGIHPLAGQGANLGFGDIRTLIELIDSSKASDSKMIRIFRQYERQQKLENYSMDLVMTGLDSIFASENVFISSLRRVGLAFINSNTFSKSLFASRVLKR